MNECDAADLQDRAITLTNDPMPCQSVPHRTLAGRDVLELIMTSKASDFPDLFGRHRDGNRWRWINRPMGIDDSFTFPDETTLPGGPIEYTFRQRQGDFAVPRAASICGWMRAWSPCRNGVGAATA